MSGQGSRQIRTNLSMAGEILGFHMNQELNAHGICIVEGIVLDGCNDDFAKENNSSKRVEITLSNGEAETDKIIFAGVIGELSIFQEGTVYGFKVTLYSATFLMDLEKKAGPFRTGTCPMGS